MSDKYIDQIDSDQEPLPGSIDGRKYFLNTPDNMAKHIVTQPDSVYLIFALGNGVFFRNDGEEKTSTRKLLKLMAGKATKDTVEDLVRHKLVQENEAYNDQKQLYRYLTLTEEGKKVYHALDKEAWEKQRAHRHKLHERGSIWPEIDKVTFDNVEKYFELIHYMLEDGGTDNFSKDDVANIMLIDVFKNKKLDIYDTALVEKGLTSLWNKGLKEQLWDNDQGYDPHERALKLQEIADSARHSMFDMCKCNHVKFDHWEGSATGREECLLCEGCRKFTWTPTEEQEKEQAKWKLLDSVVKVREQPVPENIQFAPMKEKFAVAINAETDTKIDELIAQGKFKDRADFSVQAAKELTKRIELEIADKTTVEQARAYAESLKKPGEEVIPVSGKTLPMTEGEPVEVNITDDETGAVKKTETWVKKDGVLHPTDEIVLDVLKERMLELMRKGVKFADILKEMKISPTQAKAVQAAVQKEARERMKHYYDTVLPFEVEAIIHTFNQVMTSALEDAKNHDLTPDQRHAARAQAQDAALKLKVMLTDDTTFLKSLNHAVSVEVDEK